MSSDKVESVLQSQNIDHLKSFHWDILLQELSEFAPILSSHLTSATKTRVSRSNTDAVIGMCAAILLNHQNPEMNLIQKINSRILYAGHSSKHVCKYYASLLWCIDLTAPAFIHLQVYQRLQRLNLTTSHSSLIRLLEKVGKGYNDLVLKWRDVIVANVDSDDEHVS